MADTQLTTITGISRLSGSFWVETYDRRDQPEALFAAVAELAKQFRVMRDEMQDTIARSTLRPYRRERWFPLVLKASELNTSRGSLLRYGEDAVFGPQPDGRRFYFGVSTTQYYLYPLPAELWSCGGVATRIQQPGRYWTPGFDVIIDPVRRVIMFKDDPLQDPLTGAVVTDEDTTATLWLRDALFEHNDVYRQSGFAFGMSPTQNSEIEKAALLPLADSIVGGTSLETFAKLVAACTGVPRTSTDEVVVDISADAVSPLLLTDKAAHRLPGEATVPWQIGETIPAGTFVTEDVSIRSFSQVTLPTWFKALSLPKGIVSAGFQGGFTLSNRDVPVVTKQRGSRTYVSFDIGGTPEDSRAFFELVHARGATGVSLWDALESEYGANPKTVNPLQFFIKHWFRGSLLVVRVTERATRAPGWNNLRFLQKLIPPHTLLVILVDLQHAPEPFTISPPALDRFLAEPPLTAETALGTVTMSIRPVAMNCE